MDNDAGYLIAPLLGWLVAQAFKYALKLRKDGWQWGDMTASGGMPSSHAAFTTAFLSVVGSRYALFSFEVGITFVVWAIVLYDATHVRRSVGEQGTILRLITGKDKSIKPFFVAEGHTKLQALAGIIVGAAAGIVVAAVTR